MNIGIITYHRAENYGSALQAYALNKYIRNLNSEFKVETIDYYSDIQKGMYKIFQPNNSLMNFVRNIHSLIYYKPLVNKKKKFDNFINKYIPLSINIGSDTNQLVEYSKKYNICICGSDQIWNLHCADQDENYFLSFVSNSTKVSYAPSLGLNSFSDEENNIFKKHLRDFKYISVREKSGANYLQNILNRTIETVADPVFLLTKEEWSEISKKTITEKYILCYFIGDSKGLREFAKKVQKETGYKAIVILKNLRDIKYSFSPYFDVGPLEFLGLIQNAEFIITTSFHAVAFSILFNKKFWVFTGNKYSPNDRIYNICEITSLRNRILTSENCLKCNINESINYNIVNEKIKEYRTNSIKYINKVINND